jgi:hypothetical protein
VKDESREIESKEGVEFDDSVVTCVEGEDHMPDGARVESGESVAQAARGPIEDRDGDDIRKTTESGEQKAGVRGERGTGDGVGESGRRRGERKGRASVWKGGQHGRELPVEG